MALIPKGPSLNSQACLLLLSLFVLPQVGESAMGPLKVAETAQVNVAATPQVRVAGTAELKIAGTTKLHIAGTPDLKIAGTSELKIAGTEELKIAGTANVQVAGQKSQAKKPHLVWVKYKLVPEYIDKGPFAGKGTADQILKKVQNLLPNYTHENRWVTSQRFITEMQRDGACSAHVWNFPSLMVASKPFSVTSPYGLYALKSKAHLLGKKGQVLDLAKTLENQNLVFGVVNVGSKQEIDRGEVKQYARPVLDLIVKHRGLKSRHIYEMGGGRIEVPLKMLDKNRLDYLIGNIQYAASHAKINKVPNSYQFFNITQDKTYRRLYIGCSKTPKGYKAIKEMNKKIINRKFMKEVLEIKQAWNDDNPAFRKLVTDHFLKGKANKNIID
ncbi:MAG: hypothetical protein QNL04_08760 [SAR324 cluster bacterium]|nr:hypothetical protein [SAR324 cluster bacterium]